MVLLFFPPIPARASSAVREEDRGLLSLCENPREFRETPAVTFDDPPKLLRSPTFARKCFLSRRFFPTILTRSDQSRVDETSRQPLSHGAREPIGPPNSSATTGIRLLIKQTGTTHRRRFRLNGERRPSFSDYSSELFSNARGRAFPASRSGSRTN